MRRTIAALLVLSLLLASGAPAFGHCEMPCGIYDDDARFSALGEDMQTLDKAMKMIVLLSEEPGKNMNQLVRWVNTKEQHADRVREVITDYFLAQRVKTPDSDDAVAQDRYTRQLVVLHKMIVATMKCKQTTDPKVVEKLHGLTHEFQALYRGK